MNEIKNNKTSLIKPIVLIVILAAVLLIPFYTNPYIVNIVMLMFLYMAFGQAWNLLSGYTGLVSLGQQIFIGLSGFSLAIATEVYDLPISVGILIGAVVCVLVALIMSLSVFKMSGVYFTIGTWIYAEAIALLVKSTKFCNYDLGFTISASYDLTQNQLFYIAAGVGIASILVLVLILRSKLGLALMAMSDDESAAEVKGVELYKAKLKCFLISALMTAVTGAVMYLSIVFIKASKSFSIDWTVIMVFVVIIGGIGTIEGPILGAIIYVIIQQYLYDYAGYSNIILGAIAILVILFLPKGIMGTLHNLLGFEFISVRRSPPMTTLNSLKNTGK